MPFQICWVGASSCGIHILQGGDAGSHRLQLGLDAALPGRVVIGVAEVLRVWEFQDEPDTAVVHGEPEGVQVALGGVGEAVGAVAVGGFQISTCAALGYNASETAT